MLLCGYSVAHPIRARPQACIFPLVEWMVEFSEHRAAARMNAGSLADTVSARISVGLDDLHAKSSNPA